MLKEKYQNAKRFVKEHKADIALCGLAITGTALIGQHILINTLGKNDKELLKNDEYLLKLVEIIGRAANMANEDIEALAECNGLTIEDVWSKAFDKKYNLNDNN